MRKLFWAKTSQIRMRRVALALVVGAIVLTAHPGQTDTPDGRFVDGGSEITDNVTGLIWQKTDASTGVAWMARSCPSTWRVPTVDELYSLVDARIAPGAEVADPMFGLTADYYWTNQSVSSSAWFLNFAEGSVAISSQANTFRVRCVR